MREAVQTWRVDVRVLGHDGDTTADAVLTTATGSRLHGHGRADPGRGRQDAPDAPDAGEMAAAAAALRQLADRLLQG